MSEWVPVIAAFIGALVAGFLSYRASALALSKEESSEKRNIILQKLEEAHLVARSIRQADRESFRRTMNLLMTGQAETALQQPSEIDRLFMLVGFYFPDLLPIVETLNEERMNLGTMQTNAIIAATKSIASREETLGPLAEQSDKLSSVCDELMQALTSLARKHLKL